MDANTQAVYERLLKIRDRHDIPIRPCKFIKSTYVGYDGQERPFSFRYYQIQGFLHLAAMRRFLLGDDTGIGKTLQVIGALGYLWEKTPDQKVLIITTKSSAPQWVNEFARFTKGVRAILCRGTPKKRKAAYRRFLEVDGPTVLVMGYGSAVRDISILQEWSDFILVTDEATAYKNASTQVHQVVRHLSNQATRTWALTATLIKNNLLEGFGIYRVVVPNLFPTKSKFMTEYCIIKMQRIKGNRQVPVIVGYHDWQIAAFKKKIDPYFLGRPKHEVSTELPVLTQRTITCSMTHEQEEKYAEALDGLLTLAEGTKDEEEREVSKLTSIIYCQEIVNHLALIDCPGDSDKLDTLQDLLTKGDLAGEKIILFTRFRRMVDYLDGFFKGLKIKSVRITGNENGNQRKKAQDIFQDPNSGTNIIMITMAGGEAINLQAAKALIFYDSPWSAGDYLQILGRMIRIGSEHDRVYALHLVSKGSVDTRVQEVLKSKMVLIEAVIGKRLKGSTEDAPTTFEVKSEINDLFDALTEDARQRSSA